MVSSFLAVASRYYTQVKQSESALVQGTIRTAESVATPAMSGLAALPAYYPELTRRLDDVTLSQLETAERVTAALTTRVQQAVTPAVEVIAEENNKESAAAEEKQAVGVAAPVAAVVERRVVAPTVQLVAVVNERAVSSLRWTLEQVENAADRIAPLQDVKMVDEPLSQRTLRFVFTLPRRTLATTDRVSRATADLARCQLARAAETKKAVTEQTAARVERSGQYLVELVANTSAAARQTIAQYPTARTTTESTAHALVALLSFQRAALEHLRAAIKDAEVSRKDPQADPIARACSYLPKDSFGLALTSIDYGEVWSDYASNLISDFARNIETTPTSGKDDTTDAAPAPAQSASPASPASPAPSSCPCPAAEAVVSPIITAVAEPEAGGLDVAETRHELLDDSTPDAQEEEDSFALADEFLSSFGGVSGTEIEIAEESCAAEEA